MAILEKFRLGMINLNGVCGERGATVIKQGTQRNKIFLKAKTRLLTRAARFFDQFTRHLFLDSLEYVLVAMKRIWTRVAVFCCGESVA